MKRREFISLVGSAAAAWPLSARAQQQAGAPVRVGYLTGSSTSGGLAQLACFRAGLSSLGWIEGKNINIEARFSEGIEEQYPPLAAELVRLNPNLIVVSSTPGAQAIQRATTKIPVVFIAVSDPVKSGIVASLARPGGNLTGVSNFLPATSGKLIELLKTVAPDVSRIAVIHNPTNPGKILELHALEAGGKLLHVSIEPLEVRSSGDFDRAFLSAARLRCDAFVVLQEGVTLTNRQRIIEYAIKNRLPAIYQIREFVDAGGLLSYGLNYCQHFRRAATYVDKILKGAKPADLPVELPTTFELVINLKAAKAIGLTMPPTMLTRADEVIE